MCGRWTSGAHTVGRNETSGICIKLPTHLLRHHPIALHECILRQYRFKLTKIALVRHYKVLLAINAASVARILTLRLAGHRLRRVGNLCEFFVGNVLHSAHFVVVEKVERVVSDFLNSL